MVGVRSSPLATGVGKLSPTVAAGSQKSLNPPESRCTSRSCIYTSRKAPVLEMRTSLAGLLFWLAFYFLVWALKQTPSEFADIDSERLRCITTSSSPFSPEAPPMTDVDSHYCISALPTQVANDKLSALPRLSFSFPWSLSSASVVSWSSGLTFIVGL